jgi:hypothetical protein
MTNKGNADAASRGCRIKEVKRVAAYADRIARG